MAIDAATLTSDFSGFITPERAGPIFERAARQSVVQRLVQRVPMGPSGTSIPVVTGRPSAGWVSEGSAKPASSGSMTLKTMSPKKIAVIMVNSAEVVRLNPGQFVDVMQNSIAEAFAVAFDRAALHDEGPDGTGGAGPFSTFVDQTTKTQEVGEHTDEEGGLHQDLVGALEEIVTDSDASGRRYRLTGWALDSVVEPVLWGAMDANGRPLYVDLPPADADALAGSGRLLNRPSFMGEGVATDDQETVVGYGGDWGQCAWGVIGGISYDISTEAPVTIDGSLTSLWEHNLVGIRAEAEYGFVCNDTDAFVKLTNSGS